MGINSGDSTDEAQESGLYDYNRAGKSKIDASMIEGAPTKDLMSIISHNDLSEEDMALVKAEVNSRNQELGLLPVQMSAEEIKQQREATEAAMGGKGGQGSTTTGVGIKNETNSVTHNAFSSSPDPRTTDPTIGRTSKVALD